MTLITYPTRVHFADEVLEEAMHSELEQGGYKAALLISEEMLVDPEFTERVRGSFPHGCHPHFQSFGHGVSYAELWHDFSSGPFPPKPDIVIAYGTARAIEAASAIRRSLHDRHGNRPPLFAIPGVDGLPDIYTGKLESWRLGLPAVVICDPTLTRSASASQTLRAVVKSLVRCIESYLGPTYNPAADGMALDGFNRCLRIMTNLNNHDDRTRRRDVMAASLTAAMAQEKGIGPTQLLSGALAENCASLEQVEAARLLLPGIVAVTRREAKKADTLLRMLAPEATSLDQALRLVLSTLPPPRRLSDMGATHADLRVALKAIKGRDDIAGSAAAAVLEDAF